MKRCWFGLILLAVLLVGSLLETAWMSRNHAALAETVAQAGGRAFSGDWEDAGALLDRARENWEQHWHLSAAFADHGPMESIDGLFAQLEAAAQCGDAAGFLGLCGLLESQLEALGDAHHLNWWNFL